MMFRRRKPFVDSTDDWYAWLGVDPDDVTKTEWRGSSTELPTVTVTMRSGLARRFQWHGWFDGEGEWVETTSAPTWPRVPPCPTNPDVG